MSLDLEKRPEGSLSDDKSAPCQLKFEVLGVRLKALFKQFLELSRTDNQTRRRADLLMGQVCEGKK